MTDAAIAIRDLCKTYEGGKRALDGVSFDVPQGTIFGLLGPNGAGKSTLINILAGLVNKTSGSASIWGFDIDAPGVVRKQPFPSPHGGRCAKDASFRSRTSSGG